MKRIICILSLIFCAIFINAQTYQPNWQSLDTRPVPEWYRNSKFGIFIHWGVYAVPGFTSKGNYSEWYQHAMEHGDSATKAYHKANYGNNTYYQFADHFTADLFNPDDWAKLFEASKFIRLTGQSTSFVLTNKGA